MMTIHAPGRLFMKTLVLTITLITSCFQTGFAQNKVFDIVRSGDLESLQKMPASSFVGEVRNADGYTVLQWLILHYVDYDLDRYYGDEEAMTNNVILSDAYRSCMLHLLNNGANMDDRSPEGYNALQLAVVHGKWGATDLLIQRSANPTVRDAAGNTLLHLSVLADNENTLGQFWDRLRDRLLSDEVNLTSLNYAGQTPIAYYFTSPHQLSNNSNKLVSALMSSVSLQAKDVSGMSAMDYAGMYNDWAVFTLNMYLNAATRIEKEWEEVNRKLQAQIEENKRLLEEYERRQESGEGEKLLSGSFTQTYYSECNINSGGKLYGSRLDEPITITVTPDMIWVSSLEAYYGGFAVESSGYEMVGSEKWEIYYFKRTANNTTYLAIGFPVNINHSRVMFKTSSGFEGLCY